MEKFKAGDKVRLVVKDQYAKKPNVKNGVFLFSPAGNEWVVNIQENKMVRLECCEDWELDTEAQPEPKPMLGTITPVPEFKPRDRVVHKQNQRNGIVVKPFGTPFVVTDDGYVNFNLDQWELAKNDDPKISLKSGPLEGRKVISKVLKVDGVIYWNDQYESYKVKTNNGCDLHLTRQFELVGDDPVESKPDDFPREFDTDDRIDALEKKIAEAESRIVALEKRLAELEKKAKPQTSEEAIIREFMQWMNEEGWVQLHEDTDKYIKEVLNK